MTLAAYMLEHNLTDGELAADLGVSGELVRLWRHGRRSISAKRAIEISNLTGIPRHELRPDLLGAPDPTPPVANDIPKPKTKRPRSAAADSNTPTSSVEAA